MKTTPNAYKYNLEAGRGGLEWYKYYTPGLAPYKTKARVVEALELGIIVFRIDKIMNTKEKWNGTNWA